MTGKELFVQLAQTYTWSLNVSHLKIKPHAFILKSYCCVGQNMQIYLLHGNYYWCFNTGVLEGVLVEETNVV